MTKSERRRRRAIELDRSYESFLVLHEKVTGQRIESCTRKYRDRCLAQWVNSAQLARANREAVTKLVFPDRQPEENPHGTQSTAGIPAAPG